MAQDSSHDGRLLAIEQKSHLVDFQYNNISGRYDKLENRVDIQYEKIIRLEESQKALATKDFVVKTAIGTVLAITAVLTLQVAVQKFWLEKLSPGVETQKK